MALLIALLIRREKLSHVNVRSDIQRHAYTREHFTPSGRLRFSKFAEVIRQARA
jgi:hypothetical protein